MSAAEGVRSTRSETHFVGQPLLPIDRDHLRIRLGEIVSRTIKQIAGDFLRRKEGYKRDTTLLESGFWYPCEYFAALKECKKEKRLEYFVKNGSFYHCYPNPKLTGFQSLSDPESLTGKRPGAFILSPGRSASKALQALQQNLIIGDCVQCCQVGQYQALLEILGEERFDKLFSSDPNTRMIISNYAIKANPLFFFLNHAQNGGSKGSRNVYPGQRVGFRNYKDYELKHMTGESASYNAICVDATPGAQKFVTLGTPAEGFTEDQMLHFMTEEYNHEPVGFSIYTVEMVNKMVAKLGPLTIMEGYSRKDHKITPAENAANEAGFFPDGIFFNLGAIELALYAPLELLSIEYLKDTAKRLAGNI